MNRDWDYLPFYKLCVAYSFLHFLYTVMCELDTRVSVQESIAYLLHFQKAVY